MAQLGVPEEVEWKLGVSLDEQIALQKRKGVAGEPHSAQRGRGRGRGAPVGKQSAGRGRGRGAPVVQAQASNPAPAQQQQQPAAAAAGAATPAPAAAEAQVTAAAAAAAAPAPAAAQPAAATPAALSLPRPGPSPAMATLTPSTAAGVTTAANITSGTPLMQIGGIKEPFLPMPSALSTPYPDSRPHGKPAGKGKDYSKGGQKGGKSGKGGKGAGKGGKSGGKGGKQGKKRGDDGFHFKNLTLTNPTGASSGLGLAADPGQLMTTLGLVVPTAANSGSAAAAGGSGNASLLDFSAFGNPSAVAGFSSSSSSALSLSSFPNLPSAGFTSNAASNTLDTTSFGTSLGGALGTWNTAAQSFPAMAGDLGTLGSLGASNLAFSSSSFGLTPAYGNESSVNSLLSGLSGGGTTAQQLVNPSSGFVTPAAFGAAGAAAASFGNLQDAIAAGQGFSPAQTPQLQQLQQQQQQPRSGKGGKHGGKGEKGGRHGPSQEGKEYHRLLSQTQAALRELRALQQEQQGKSTQKDSSAEDHLQRIQAELAALKTQAAQHAQDRETLGQVLNNFLEFKQTQQEQSTKHQEANTALMAMLQIQQDLLSKQRSDTDSVTNSQQASFIAHQKKMEETL
eukprot:gene23103-35405_t